MLTGADVSRASRRVTDAAHTSCGAARRASSAPMMVVGTASNWAVALNVSRRDQWGMTTDATTTQGLRALTPAGTFS
jgi:hypothetical protein